MNSSYKKIALSLFFLCFLFHANALEGLLIKTIDYSLNDKWYKTVSSTVPTFSDCKILYQQQELFVAVVVGGLELNKEGQANVEYSISISGPKNPNYFSEKNLPLIHNKKVNPKYLHMSEAVLRLKIKEDDPLGKYKIKVHITDLVSGKSTSVKADFKVAKLLPYTAFEVKNEADFSAWMVDYYQSPTPEKALANYLFYTQSKLSENDNSFFPVFSFMLEIFNHNPFLEQQILDAYDKQDDKTKIHLIYLLHFSEIDASDFLNKLQGIELAAYQELQNSAIPNPFGEIIDPAQLDMLWSNFMASGSYQSILKLIQTLDYVQYQGKLKAYGDSEKTETDRQQAINNSIYDALVWSFGSNCKQHHLVKKYALWALENETLSKVQKEELKQILEGL